MFKWLLDGFDLTDEERQVGEILFYLQASERCL